MDWLKKKTPIIRTSESTLIIGGINMGPIIAYQSKKVTFTLYLCVWIAQTIIKEHTEYINTYMCLKVVYVTHIAIIIILIFQKERNLYVERFRVPKGSI